MPRRGNPVDSYKTGIVVFKIISVLKKTIYCALRLCATAVIMLCMMWPEQLQAQELTFSQCSYQVPVLIKKKDNPVLRIMVYNAGPQSSYTDGFQLLLHGTTDLKDIKRVKLYYAGKDSSFTSLISTDKMKLVGSKELISDVMWVGDEQELTVGANVFWVSVELNEKADLLHKIFVSALASMQGHQNPVKIPTGNAQPLRLGYAIRQHNDDGVHTYRIPGLSTAKDGTLLAIYDARRESARDLQGDIDIVVNRSTDKGRTWLPMQVVIDMGAWGGLPQKFNGVSDANILVDKKTGNIFIAGLWMHGLLDSTGKWIEGLTDTSTVWNHQWKAKGSQPGFDVKQSSQFMIVKSTDNGKTWSQPVNLTKQLKQEDWWLLAPAPGAGITLQDGTLVFPTEGRDKKGSAFSCITYSKDGGATWHTTKQAINDEVTTENMAVELSDGSIMLNMRCNKNAKDTGSTNGRVVAVTKDLGLSWTKHPTSHGALPEPVCMASIIRHDYVVKGKKRSVLLFSNPDSKTLRNHMTIKVSYDDGRTWVDKKKILLDEGKSRGYSCLTSIDKDTIGILYESSQSDMVFQKISLKELL
jgi:sialidase-1